MDTSKIRERIYNDSSLRDRIAQRAYYIALQRQFQPGRDFENWVQAENEIFQQLIVEEKAQEEANIAAQLAAAAVPVVTQQPANLAQVVNNAAQPQVTSNSPTKKGTAKSSTTPKVTATVVANNAINVEASLTAVKLTPSSAKPAASAKSATNKTKITTNRTNSRSKAAKTVNP
jgi:hypothetical protein